jgi:hypothetical protein
VSVRVGFDQLDPRILPDMGIKVTFLREPAESPATAGQPIVLVPKAAVRAEEGQSVVFVIRGDVPERRAVSVGGTDGDRVEVIAGLRGGERVVVSPPAELDETSRVIVK